VRVHELQDLALSRW